MKLNRKKMGISLIALITSIVVMLILLTVIIIGVNSSTDNSALVAFAGDLSQVEDLAKTYYIEKDEMPTLDADKIALNQDQIIALAGAKNQSSLVDELTRNNDYVADGTKGEYYKIDLEKIGVASSVRGTKRAGVENDIYVFSYPSMNVYYLKGLKAKKDMYFSLSDKLLKITKIELDNKKSEATTDVKIGTNIKLSRPKKTWTNKLDITVESKMEAGEKIYISIPVSPSTYVDREITGTVVGDNVMKFETFAELKLKALSLTDADISSFNTLQQELKYIEVVKKETATMKELGRIRVNLNNYETLPPLLDNSSVVIESKDFENYLSFNVSDELSKIKEVRYEYLKKFDNQGEIVSYHPGVLEFDENYMLKEGKKATVSEAGYVQIKVPKNIEGIQVLIVDNAGNWTKMTQNTHTGIYIGFIEKEVDINQVTFKLVFNSLKGIKKVDTSISLDGITYTRFVSKTLNTNEVKYTLDVDDYTNLTGSTGVFHIKAEVENMLGSKETRIFEIK